MDTKGISDEFKKIELSVVILSLLSAFFYQLGFLFIFFLIPLQFLRNTKGFMPMFKAAVIVIAITVIVSFIKTARVETFALRSALVVSEIYIIVMMLLGFLYINYSWPGNPRMLKKLFIATIGAFFIGIPLLLIMNSAVIQNHYKSYLTVFFEALTRTFYESPRSYYSDIAAIFGTIDVETVYNNIKRTILRSYLFLYFVLLAGSWWLGSIKNVDGKWSSKLSLLAFSIPNMLWPLIIALLTVVIDSRISIGFLGHIGWNMLLIIATLYGLRGIGIIQTLLLVLNAPRILRVITYVTLVLFLMQPGLNFVVLIAVPALGLSEIWINYKNIREKKHDNEDNS